MIAAVDPQVAAAIAGLVAEVKATQVPQSNWTRPFKELDIDSLEVANLLLSVEEKYGLKISDQEAEGLSSIRELAAFVSRRTGKS